MYCAKCKSGPKPLHLLSHWTSTFRVITLVVRVIQTEEDNIAFDPALDDLDLNHINSKAPHNSEATSHTHRLPQVLFLQLFTHLDSNIVPLVCLGTKHLSQAGCSHRLAVEICK